MKQYLELLKDILKNGEKRHNRTGIDTISVFGRQLHFDMTKGFPIVTTKKVPFKSVVSELLWFLEGSSDEKRLAEIKNDNRPYNTLTDKEKHTIWTDNYEYQGKSLGYYDGNLGPVYGHQFRKLYDIDFNTIEITINANKCECRHRSSDLYENVKPTLYGKGYLGYITKDDRKHPHYKRIHKTWTHMIERCYYLKSKSYKTYGAVGIKVCDRWLCFANFLRDFQYLKGYEEWCNDKTYQIDKDIYGSSVYSPETVILIPRYYNISLSASIPLEYNSKYYRNVKDLQIKEHLTKYRINKMIKQGIVKKLIVPNGKHVTYKIRSYDQIQNAINLIRNDPVSRRIIVDSWNPAMIDKMALPPCHFSFQFYVSGKKNQYLSLMWTQRSVDTFLGLPFNISSYALLLCIIAKMTNKKPKELICNLGDVHIYENHLEQINEQLKRKPKKLPKLELPEKLKVMSTIDMALSEISASDFTLKNYKSHETLKGKMAV